MNTFFLNVRFADFPGGCELVPVAVEMDPVVGTQYGTARVRD